MNTEAAAPGSDTAIAVPSSGAIAPVAEASACTSAPLDTLATLRQHPGVKDNPVLTQLLSLVGERMAASESRSTQSIDALLSKVVMFYGHLQQQLDDIGESVTGVSGDVQGLTSTVEKLVDEAAENAKERAQREERAKKIAPYSFAFSNEKNKQMASILPVMVNGVDGRMAWVPVIARGESFAVVSTPVAGHMIQHATKYGAPVIHNFLMSNLKRHPSFSLDVGQNDTDLFVEIMLRTPFKVYKMSSPKSVANNRKYIIMDARYWKDLLLVIKSECPDRPLSIAPAKDLPIPDTLMCNRISVKLCNEPHQSEKDLVVDYDNMDPVMPELSYEQRALMPAMDTCMWEEAYGPGFIEFFGMEPLNGRMGHVVHGEYVPPTENQYARTYAQVIDKLKELMVDGDKRQSRTGAERFKKRRHG